MTLPEFRLACFVYCCIAHASETQGYRTGAHNVKVGGVAHSPHRFGFGDDVVYDDDAPVLDRVETARRLGLRLVPEADHDHLQPLDWEAG